MISETQTQNQTAKPEPKKTVKGISGAGIKKELNQIAPIIENPFKNYMSYNTYYKAKIKYNVNLTNPQLKVFQSYKSDIGIYNPQRAILILNYDLYNCSKTTKEQLNFFINTETATAVLRVIYVNPNLFERLISYFESGDAGAYELSEHEIIKNYEKDKSIIETIETPYLTNPEKLEELRPYIQEIKQYHKEKQLKTVTQITNYYQIGNSNQSRHLILKHKYSISNKNNKITSDKLKLIRTINSFKDYRKQEDKKLFNSYDMGITNTKDLKRIYY